MERDQLNDFTRSSTYVILRFTLRLTILIALAFVPQIGFAEAFPRLLLIGSVFCVLWGITERERLLAPMLTHWDEAVVLVFMSKLSTAFL
jgi:hypothetical protein